MCRLPVGAELIWASHPCPPGFIVANVCVLPGVPAVLKDMWSKVAERFHGPEVFEARFRAERGESVTEFLDHAALVAESDDVDEQATVILLTIHNAKGLEFPVVFITGLEEGLIPHAQSKCDIK